MDKAAKFYIRPTPSQQAEATNHLKMAQLRAQAGDMEGAIESSLDALALVPRDAQAWHALGIFYIQAGVLELARDAFLQAQLLEPTLPTVNAHLGRLLLPQRAHEETVLHPKRAVGLYAPLPDSLWALIGAYLTIGQSEHALILWRHVENLASVVPA